MRRDPVAYGFRPVTRADLPMIAKWLAEPHMVEWWGEAQASLAEIAEAIDDPATEPHVVELDGEPIGYVQSYDPHREDGHPYRDQPAGTLGMDISIGVPALLGRGHGTEIVRQFAERLLTAGASRIVIDPDPENLRAIRAYEKAGFTAFDTRMSKYGPALMMARDVQNQSKVP